MLKASLLQRRDDGLQILPSVEDVDVRRIAYRRLIDFRDPRGNGVTSGHGIRNPRRGQRPGGTTNSFAHFLHGSHHPIEGVVTHPIIR